MIRFINCFRRHPEHTLAQFREVWDGPEFEALVQRSAEMVGALQVVKSATLVVEANVFVQLNRGMEEPFDGVLEYFLPSAAPLAELAQREAFWDFQREMTAFQASFLDVGRSVGFFTEADQ